MRVHIGPYREGGKKRKIKVKIDPYDVWSLDYTLAIIIHPALKALKKAKAGTPWTDVADAPHIPDKPDQQKEMAGFRRKRWKWILNEMIFAFKCDLDDWDLEIYEKAGNSWTPEALEERRKISDRIANGHRLFAKYYNNLWT